MFRAILGGLCACSVAVAGCGDRPDDRHRALDAGLGADGGTPADAGAGDSGDELDSGLPPDGATPVDAGRRDADAVDAAADDAGRDGGFDAGWDGGFDAGWDGGFDAGWDAGWDGGFDAGWDGGFDAGGGSCITAGSATHAVRFEWTGSAPSSTAYVDYELNELPDTTRWHVSAASASIGYTPAYGDTFLGDGGLVLEGTAFIDVELSTVGLSTIRGVTLAIRGRSYNTTASGSFTWQTFDGTGATPSGFVANSAPYEWYPADATTAFSPGDDRVLLRIRAGPPSGSLIVNRVEICFDAS